MQALTTKIVRFPKRNSEVNEDILVFTTVILGRGSFGEVCLAQDCEKNTCFTLSSR